MVKVFSLDKNQLEHETNMEYINRICSVKDTLGMTWKEISELFKDTLGMYYSPSYYSKNFKAGNFNTNADESTTTSSCEDMCETCDNLSDCLSDWAESLSSKDEYINTKLHELALKKVEVSDLVTQNNAYIRRLSREQTMKDIAADYARVMSKEKLLDLPDFEAITGTKEGILLISDWHYGMVCDNPWNKFDPDICKARVAKLLNKVIEIVKTNDLRKVTILDLADLIAGRIHMQIRIESRFDVITQTMQVCEILAEFISELSKHCYVDFYSCLDNHSRLEPNKKESLDLESLARIIPWYLKDRMMENHHVNICGNVYGADIITCNVCGHNIIGVHGDSDKPTSALEKLSLMTQEHYAMLCTAHFHHFSADESHQSIILSNSSLMGVDSYAEKLRLTSKPSQTFVISSTNNICEAIYKINLD